MKPTQGLSPRFVIGLIVLAITLTFPLKQAWAQTCATGAYDMLDWMTLDPSYRQNGYYLKGYRDDNSFSNPLYTYISGDQINWIKHDNQKIWDVMHIANGQIYWWITELDKFCDGTTYNWGSATGQDYKQQLANGAYGLLAMDRCTVPGSGSLIANTDTRYVRKVYCSVHCTQDLGAGVKFWVDGPFTVTYGGNLPSNIQVLKLTYMYNCATASGTGRYADVSQCKDYEAYYLSKTYGLLRWELYHRDITDFGVQFTKKDRITYNQLVGPFAGSANPYHPCF